MFANKSVKSFINLLLIWGLINSGRPQESDVPSVCNTGQKQSPIDISMENVNQKQYNNDHILKLINYNVRSNRLTIQRMDKNHVKLSGSWDGQKPTISGSVLSNETYVFSQAHVHWSQDDNNGTEHSFEQKRFATELHAVHVNSKYADMTEALKHPDGFAVVGVLFKVDNKVPRNDGIHKLATLLQSSVPADNVQRSLERSFDFSTFLPKLISSFFYYDGSLTTAPCTENVRWIVLAKPLPISSATMRLLRNNKIDIESESVRPLQPLNCRTIELYERK